MLRTIIGKVKKKTKPFEEWQEKTKFIWGIKSQDDPSDSESNLYTMNDFDIVYDRDRQVYRMGVETIYQFENGRKSEQAYIKNIFDKFTVWMQKQGYNTKLKLSLSDIFTTGMNVNSEFESIERLYAGYKFLVYGFVMEA